jgi:hypothetical protein
MKELFMIILIAVVWLAMIAKIATHFRNGKQDNEMFKLMRRSYPDMNDAEAKLFWENEQVRIKEELERMGKEVKDGKQ